MDILAAVTARLSALGYTADEADKGALEYNTAKAETYLKSSTNQLEVPEGLLYVWADMAAGYFLTDKKASGGLSDTYDFGAPAKSISEGDTSVTFALADSGSFEEQFDAMLEKMTHPNEELILAFRRLVW
nr:MAG TPA: head to tail adaptor [Caudoviricetes sp.]